jgi:hypothetical protein
MFAAEELNASKTIFYINLRARLSHDGISKASGIRRLIGSPGTFYCIMSPLIRVHSDGDFKHRNKLFAMHARKSLHQG